MKTQNKKIDALLAEYFELNEIAKTTEKRLKVLRDEVSTAMQNALAMESLGFQAIKTPCQRENLDRELLNEKFGKPKIDACVKLIEYFQLKVLKRA